MKNFFAKQVNFFACNVCGNLIIKLNDSGLTPVCCGRDMEELTPGTSDGAFEKHVPIWEMEGCKVMVTVGSEPHPMTQDHYIQWIIIETNKGYYCKHLSPSDEPETCIKLCKNEVVKNVYEFCNLHKLWKAEVKGEDYDCPLCGI